MRVHLFHTQGCAAVRISQMEMLMGQRMGGGRRYTAQRPHTCPSEKTNATVNFAYLFSPVR